MSQPDLTLYLIRHGISTAFYQKPPVRQGPLHPLSPTGISQAKARGEELSRLKIDVLLTSPLLRAKETAKILESFPRTPFSQTIDEIQEFVRPDVIYGIPRDGFSNRLYKVALKDSIDKNNIGWRIEDYPEVWNLLLHSLREVGLNHEPGNLSESWTELFYRSATFRDRLVKEYMGQRVAVVSHSNFSAFLLSAMLLKEPDARSIFSKSSNLYLRHGGMTIVEYRRGQWILTPRFDHNRRSP